MPPSSQQPTQTPQPVSSNADKYLIPINRSGWAIAAGYFSLLNLIFVLSFIFAPVTIFLCIMANRDIKQHPQKLGKGRIIFAYVMSALGFGIFLLLVASHYYHLATS